MSRPLVLVGFAEASAAPEVVWSLADAGFDVAAFARRGRPSALRHSRHVRCHEVTAPEVDLDAASAEIRGLMASLGGPTRDGSHVLLPLDDTAVWLCSRLPLAERWVLAGPTGPTAELALNKHVQAERARSAGFNVPPTALALSAQDVRDFTATHAFPIILKSSECVPVIQGRRYSCKKWICASQGELDRALEGWGERVPLIVQSYIVGNGEGVFGLAAPDGVRAWSGHRRVRMMNPQGSGSSACASQPVSPEVKTCVERLVRAAGWRGLFMVELLRDQAGTVWFVELNGRPWGSMALSRRQGFEYPAWHAMLALDQTSSAGRAALEGAPLVCRHVGRELMHLLFVLRGPKSRAVKGWPSFWKSLVDVVRVRQEDTLYNWRRQDPKVFFTDCYYTLHDNLFKSRS